MFNEMITMYHRMVNYILIKLGLKKENRAIIIDLGKMYKKKDNDRNGSGGIMNKSFAYVKATSKKQR